MNKKKRDRKAIEFKKKFSVDKTELDCETRIHTKICMSIQALFAFMHDTYCSMVFVAVWYELVVDGRVSLMAQLSSLNVETRSQLPNDPRDTRTYQVRACRTRDHTHTTLVLLRVAFANMFAIRHHWCYNVHCRATTVDQHNQHYQTIYDESRDATLSTSQWWNTETKVDPDSQASLWRAIGGTVIFRKYRRSFSQLDRMALTAHMILCVTIGPNGVCVCERFVCVWNETSTTRTEITISVIVGTKNSKNEKRQTHS